MSCVFALGKLKTNSNLYWCSSCEVNVSWWRMWHHIVGIYTYTWTNICIQYAVCTYAYTTYTGDFNRSMVNEYIKVQISFMVLCVCVLNMFNIHVFLSYVDIKGKHTLNEPGKCFCLILQYIVILSMCIKNMCKCAGRTYVG